MGNNWLIDEANERAKGKSKAWIGVNKETVRNGKGRTMIDGMTGACSTPYEGFFLCTIITPVSTGSLETKFILRYSMSFRFSLIISLSHK